MKMAKLMMKQRLGQLAAATTLACACAAGLGSCSSYDLDEKNPSWLGSSIYNYLAESGKYTYTVRLIDDLGYREVLARTGSKTLFVADDEAFNRFFQNNTFGVKSYEGLSTAQKKMLLYGAMVNNSFQISNLSSTEGPTEGDCMRRLSASTVYDTVPVLRPDQMPVNPYWSTYRKKGNMVCMEDMTITPMVHFIEKFLVNQKITNDDYAWLYNGKLQRKAGDASVNGVAIVEPNIKCSNGFVHRVADVMTPLQNMANIVAHKPETSEWNKLLDRFCAPYYSKEATENYNRLYGTSVDSVFQLRFFSKKSQGGQLNSTPMGGPVKAMLKFDPGWNTYYSGQGQSTSLSVALEKDMGVMMAPSNKALDDYWNNGAGKVLRDYYGSWDKVPDDVISELINNNLFNSFVGSVPSKFSSILNDANDPMGVSKADIDSVWLGCNGAVYLTNKVYSPTSYVSVLFPAIVNESMKIIRWGVEQLQYNVYLNSLNSYYSFFIPNNKALLEYVDPVSYGKSRTQLFRFHYDGTKNEVNDRVWASIWNYDLATGEVGDSIGRASYSQVKNRLKDILDNHIVIGNVESGNTYYRTKGGEEIRVAHTAQGANGMTVEGSLQVDENKPLKVNYIYNQTAQGNGKSYILHSGPILTTRKTVRDILAEHDEFSKFLELMDGSGLFETVHDNRYACGGTNISTFNTYHYTIYVPTNASIEKLEKEGKLPTWEKVEAEELSGNTEAKSADSAKIVNFLRYHIQDNAVFIGAGEEKGDFETAAINNATGRFFKLHVVASNNGLTVRDDKGNTRHVVDKPGLYNLQAREYQYNNKDAMNAGEIETSSSAVVHLIDGPLLR